MAGDIDTSHPRRLFTEAEVEDSLSETLSQIYGEGSPLVRHVTGVALGRLALGVSDPRPTETAPPVPDSFAERLDGVRTPDELLNLIEEASARLHKHVPGYLKHTHDYGGGGPPVGLVEPYVFDETDRQKIIGQVRIWPTRHNYKGNEVRTVELQGGPDSPWDALHKHSVDQERYLYSFSVTKKKVFDPLAGEDVEVASLSAYQDFHNNSRSTHVPMKDIRDVYSLDRFTPEEKIVRRVLEQVDAAVDWYENVYSIAPNGVSYGKVKELGYVDENGDLLPNWFDLMREHHFALMWPEEADIPKV